MIGSVEDSGFKKSNTINRRMFIFAAAKAVVFVGIVGRLFSLQISENKKYLTLSDKNRLREARLPPVRGEFVDYFGNRIAKNLTVYQLHVVPEQVEDFKTLIVRLKDILNLSDSHLQELIKKKNKQKPWETLIVSENLSWDEFSKINFYLHELSGARPVLTVGRNYPYNDTYTHVLGYVSEASVEDLVNNEAIKERNVPGLRVGKTGLEKALEKELIGTNGIQRFEVNAYGKRINQIDFKEGEQGKTIKLTIDTEIQKYTQELLDNRAGSISVMDIYTGEIIAMNSSPSFDPNLFLYGIEKNKWKEITKNPLKPLLNKTVSGLYSPGSTIKPLVALSALENDVITTNLKVNCRGHKHPLELYGMKYHCWKKEGHGYMSLQNAIKQSCDTYFYEAARLLGVDRLNETAKKFGLGNVVLGKYFNEKKGVVPSTKWKKEAIGQNWYLGETLINGIGQGYIQTTPLQLCLMTAQLANGGHKIYPKIIYENNQENVETIKQRMKLAEENKVEDLNLLSATEKLFKKDEKTYDALYRNKENVKFVLDAMFRSTNEIYGTSFSSRIEDPKYQFAGKTGTAQVKRITEAERELDLKTNQIPYKERDHAWYIAFGPYKNPRYAVSILVEHGGSGSSTAAPIAKKLFKFVIDRHELREKIKKKNLATSDI
ncbi:penicillin-binding protein 2 [Candidatus Pelagibacter sp.]|nr:penicillin-binding protein 2 [Candidatus Pelagibacter sp.]